MNDRLMSHSNNMHGYRNVISHLIHDSEESLKSERSMRLIYKDTPNQLDVTEARKPNPEQLIPGFNVRTGVNNDGNATYTLIPPAEVTGNQGLHQRYLYTRQSREVQVIGNLGIDMFEQERYLIPGVGMKLRLHRQKNPFMLMAADGSYVQGGAGGRQVACASSESQSWCAARPCRCVGKDECKVSTVS